MSERVYAVILDKGVQKVLNRLPHSVNNRLILAMRSLATNPRPPGCKKLEGSENDWRIRVGEYRIIYSIEDDKLIVLVIDVGPSKDIYRRRK